MNDRDPNQLEQLLARLNESAPNQPDASAAATPDDAEDIAIIGELAHTLAARAAKDASHLNLEQITELVRDRRTKGPDWLMPDHLAGCPLCLEAFETVLAGWFEPQPATLARYGNVFPPKAVEIAGRIEGAASKADRSADRRAMLITTGRIAAAIALVAVLVVGWNEFTTRSVATTSALLLEGGLVLDDGTVTVEQATTPGRKNIATLQSIAVGQPIPSGQRAIAVERTKLTFRDGSTLDIDKRSRVAIEEPVAGQVTVRLDAGGVTAAVTKRESGQTFGVITPMGQVTVVGTRFKVTCNGEDVRVFNNTPEQAATAAATEAVIEAVSVEVYEGTVRVHNQHNDVSVTTGQTAVIRDKPPTIDVVESTP